MLLLLLVVVEEEEVVLVQLVDVVVQFVLEEVQLAFVVVV
jgi:hypothetical protein